MIFASDLDRTLIYSSEFIRALPADRYRIIEYYKGEPISYVSCSMLEALKTIGQKAVFVPVTTRSVEQYQRVQLSEHVNCPFAVTSNGGNILIDGVPDPGWNSGVRQRIEDRGEPPRAVGEKLAAFRDRPWMVKIREVEGLFHYFVVDEGRFDASELSELNRYIEASGWETVYNGRKIYFMPRALEKVNGLRRIMELQGDACIISAGDTGMDICMASVSQAFFMPGHGDEGLSGEGITRLESRGLAAGEEICTRVLERL